MMRRIRITNRGEFNGENGLTVKAPDRGSGDCGFKSRFSPHFPFGMESKQRFEYLRKLQLVTGQ